MGGEHGDIAIEYQGTIAANKESAQKPASFLDSNRIIVPNSAAADSATSNHLQSEKQHEIGGGILPGRQELQIDE